MNAIDRLIKFTLFQYLLCTPLDLVSSFVLPSPLSSAGKPVSPSKAFATPWLPQTRKKSTDTSCLFSTKMKTTEEVKTAIEKDQDDIEEGRNGSNGDGEKIQNWLLTLVLPLQLVYTSNQLTRSSIYYLVDFSGDATRSDPFRLMNVAIGFSEAQYGLLASLAFTALFAVASLGAGAAADKYNRKTLTVLSAVGWSIAAFGTSFSDTYNEVLLWRIAMGLFCAFSTPTAYTLIAEKVPTDRISLATSIYGTGVGFGGALASLSILLDNQIGWSQTMMVIGLVGVMCSILVAAVLPNDDSKSDDGDTDAAMDVDIKSFMESDEANNSVRSFSFLDDISEAISTDRAKWILVGSFLRFSSGLCIGVWSAPFFRMAFPDNASQYAVAQAFIKAVPTTISGLAGGAAADYLSSRLKADNEKGGGKGNEDFGGIKLWVPVVGSLLAAPTWYLAIHSTDSFQTAMVWLSLEYLVAECWFGPMISTLLATVPTKIRGTSQGLFTLTGAVANLSPTFLGYLYGQASSSASTSELLPVLLTTGVCFGYIASAFCYAMAAQSPPEIATTKSKSI